MHDESLEWRTFWNPIKDEKLKKERGVSFLEILNSDLIKVTDSPSRKNQLLMLFNFRGYVWVVPFVESGNMKFLKTAFPSRKYTRLWKRGELM